MLYSVTLSTAERSIRIFIVNADVNFNECLIRVFY